MSKPRLGIYSQELPDCSCFQTIFNTEFEATSTHREIDFLNSIKRADVDAGVVCFCSTSERDAEELLRLEALAGPIPLLTCSAHLNVDFVKFAAQQGVVRFLQCTMAKHTIQDIILEAIRHGGLKEFLHTCCVGSLTVSPHIHKMIGEIVHTFPRRLDENQMSERLQISRTWLKKLCNKAFQKSYTRLMRRIWIHQALRLMQHTHLDNMEIAVQLNYSEESNMARDFRKELGYTPSEARRRLIHQSPEELLRTT